MGDEVGDEVGDAMGDEMGDAVRDEMGCVYLKMVSVGVWRVTSGAGREAVREAVAQLFSFFSKHYSNVNGGPCI